MIEQGDIERAVETRREDAVSLLQRLVQVPSVTGSERAVQDLVEREFQERGLDVDRWEADPDEIEPYSWHVGADVPVADRPNLAARLMGTGGGRSILLNAHVDTVAPGDRARWTHDPYGGVVDGDLLYGRGACDMKGGLVSYLIALDALSSLGFRPGGDIIINTTVGEEDGGLGALSTVLRGYQANAVLIAEPTRLALVPAHCGSLVMRLTVRGRSAHGATRNEGVSAVEKFIPIFQDLLDFEAERNSEIEHPLYRSIENKVPISFGVVRAGNWASTVPEELVAEGRLGLMPGEDGHEFAERVRRRVESAAERDPWLREHPPEIEWVGGQFEPAETSLDAPIARAVTNAHRAVTGEPPATVGAPYGADMRLFSVIGGMDCVMYGAGDVRVAHQDDEHISISELMTAAKVIAMLLVDWCGGVS